jgi:hypothetical protein
MWGYLQICDLASVVSFAQGLSFGLDVDKVYIHSYTIYVGS